MKKSELKTKVRKIKPLPKRINRLKNATVIFDKKFDTKIQKAFS